MLAPTSTTGPKKTRKLTIVSKDQANGGERKKTTYMLNSGAKPSPIIPQQASQQQVNYSQYLEGKVVNPRPNSSQIITTSKN